MHGITRISKRSKYNGAEECGFASFLYDAPRKTGMKTGHLLEKLIQISKKSKTDFALSMNMTPSGLSKPLSGSRLPASKERKIFAEKAAHYFAEATFSIGCYLKFPDIFPIIYDFKSQHELQGFLTYAIEYTLDQDLALDNNIDLSYSERSFYYLGRRAVLNNLCALLSCCFMLEDDKSMEIYSSFPLVDPIYSDIFARIVILNPEKLNNLTFNYIFNEKTLQALDSSGRSPFLPFITAIQQNFKLNLWKSESSIAQSFVLIKGRLLLNFSELIAGTPLLLSIFRSSYLSLFYLSLMKNDVKKVSYSRSEAAAFLKSHPRFIDRLVRDGIDCVYNFTPIGFFIKKDALIDAAGSSAIGSMIWELFNGILTGKASFVVSIAAMEHFGCIEQVIVPVVGAIPFHVDQRTLYRQRYEDFSKDKAFLSKIRIIDSNLTNLAILCANQLCMVYATDDHGKNERIHVFHRDLIVPMLEQETTQSRTSALDFLGELGNAHFRNK